MRCSRLDCDRAGAEGTPGRAVILEDDGHLKNDEGRYFANDSERQSFSGRSPSWLGIPALASERRLPMTGASARSGTGASSELEMLDFDDFFENSVAAMHWLGADGTILRANQAELDLLGYSQGDVIGRHVAEFH